MAATTVFPKFASSARHLPALLAALALVTAGWDHSRSFAQPAEQPAADAPPVDAPQPADAAQPGTAVLPIEQVDQLVAPIALYPDNLLGQVLTASTYPLEIVMAARWASANAKLKGQQLEDAMQAQSWDPSVKALTAVPQVLQMMNDKLDWTKQLGEAYLAQPDDIASSVQRLRARADASGNLKATKDVKVQHVAAPPPVDASVPPEPDYIAIEPVEPDVMYVPVYDPFLVYGPWPYPAYRPFYWYPPGYVAVGVFAFGAPIVVGAALWAHYNWGSRRVDVDVGRFNRFNHARLASTSTRWQFNPAHHGNTAFNNPGLQQRYGRSNPGANPQSFGAKGGGTARGTASGPNNMTINRGNTTVINNASKTGTFNNSSKTGTFNNSSKTGTFNNKSTTTNARVNTTATTNNPRLNTTTTTNNNIRSSTTNKGNNVVGNKNASFNNAGGNRSAPFNGLNRGGGGGNRGLSLPSRPAPGGGNRGGGMQKKR